MKLNDLKLGLCKNIFDFVCVYHLLTLEEQKVIYETISEDDVSLGEIASIITLIDESIQRTPANVISVNFHEYR
jgi:hypothetical protein